ncbi:MAG TPA: cupredoxin domain-containing protein [Candidatus Limnocylindria bacterium]|nr:cupredoxin domain-containing protein [Candidatus Limnocylindria bacterium]
MPRKRPQRRSSNFRLRLAIFAILALAVAGGAAYALWPKELATADTAPVDATLRIDMSGFTPPTITAPANRLLRVRIVNPDSSHHSDGGGVHGFTIVKLGVDAKVQPETTQVVTIPPSAAGDYPFYCDTCCGGKENPAMQGVLKIKA